MATTKKNKQHLLLHQKIAKKKRRLKLLRITMIIKTKILLMMVINMTHKTHNIIQTKNKDNGDE